LQAYIDNFTITIRSILIQADNNTSQHTVDISTSKHLKEMASMTRHIEAEGTGIVPTCITPRVLLEDTWEADDVKEECMRLNVPCEEMTVRELDECDALEFSQCTYMCNTELVQRKLREVGLLHKVPSTYPDTLRGLLGRSVEQRALKDLTLSNLPIFVKPVSNDKSFDGRVVTDGGGLVGLREEAQDAACLVWVAERVSFLVEHRLFVGDGVLYGMGRIQGTRDAVPSESFVKEVLACCESGVFWAVDVGLMIRPLGGAGVGAGRGGGQNKDREQEQEREQEECWAVVEVNPPFALDDHGLAIEAYCRYCQDACTWIRCR
jgi:hypothetical protein